MAWSFTSGFRFLFFPHHTYISQQQGMTSTAPFFLFQALDSPHRVIVLLLSTPNGVQSRRIRNSSSSGRVSYAACVLGGGQTGLCHPARTTRTDSKGAESCYQPKSKMIQCTSPAPPSKQQKPKSLFYFACCSVYWPYLLSYAAPHFINRK